MEKKEEKCPCAAVAELKTMVELLSKRVDSNENRIKDGEGKLGHDYARLEVITVQIGNLVDTMGNIQDQFQEFLIEKKESEKGFKKRVHGLVDDVLRWGILLLLGYVAFKLGLTGGA